MSAPISQYPKRMQHGKHGFTHAYNSLQEAELRGNGWGCEGEQPKHIAEVIQLKKKAGRPRKVA